MLKLWLSQKKGASCGCGGTLVAIEKAGTGKSILSLRVGLLKIQGDIYLGKKLNYIWQENAFIIFGFILFLRVHV